MDVSTWVGHFEGDNPALDVEAHLYSMQPTFPQSDAAAQVSSASCEEQSRDSGSDLISRSEEAAVQSR